MNNRYHLNSHKLIEAILPTYDEYGNNSCEIIYTNEKSNLVTSSVAKFLKKWLCDSFRMDISGQRMWGRGVLDHRNLNPLIVNENIVLIPVKTRQAIGAKDGCYGYIRTSSIQSFDADYIFLYSGAKVPYLCTIRTLKKKLEDAKLFYYTYKEELMLQQRIFTGYREDQEKFRNLYAYWDQGKQ